MEEGERIKREDVAYVGGPEREHSYYRDMPLIEHGPVHEFEEVVEVEECVEEPEEEEEQRVEGGGRETEQEEDDEVDTIGDEEELDSSGSNPRGMFSLIFDPSVPTVSAFEEVSTSWSARPPRLEYHPFRTFIDKPSKYARLRIVQPEPARDDDMDDLMRPDPFRPARGERDGPDIATRMALSAIRHDNRKFRAQRYYAQNVARMESGNCDRCHMRFYLPFAAFKSHITYSMPRSSFELPVPFFRCPMCSTESPLRHIH